MSKLRAWNYTSGGTVPCWGPSGLRSVNWSNSLQTPKSLSNLCAAYCGLLHEMFQKVFDKTLAKCSKNPDSQTLEIEGHSFPLRMASLHRRYIYHMEETVAIARESFEKFYKLWSPWVVFWYSDQYLQLDTGWNHHFNLDHYSLPPLVCWNTDWTFTTVEDRSHCFSYRH